MLPRSSLFFISRHARVNPTHCQTRLISIFPNHKPSRDRSRAPNGVPKPAQQRSKIPNKFTKPHAIDTSTRASTMPADTNTSSIATTAKSDELSNHQKFARIHPPPSTFRRIESLGLGVLRNTNRFTRLNTPKELKQDQKPEPEYTFPHLTFFAGAKIPSSFPPESLLEVGFVGRSNVGKSTLINSLAGSAVVRVSDMPGLTRQINFYTAGDLFHMIDMPGYGFAFVSEEERKSWNDLMETYIGNRKTLKRIFVIIDARHGLKIGDKEFLKMLDSHSVRFQLVLTKCDLLHPPELARRHIITTEATAQYRHAVGDVLMVSALRGGGMNQMRKEILFLMGHLKEKEYYWGKIERGKMKQMKRIQKAKTTKSRGKGGVKGRTAGNKMRRGPSNRGGPRNKRRL